MRNIATSSRSLYLLPSLSFAFFCLTQNAVDPDLWGHILFGREIIETGRVPRTDVFSYTAFGQAWINHEWLSEVIFGGLYAAFGPSGILMLKSLAVATLLILITHIRRETRCVPEFQILLSLLVISVISFGFAFRPQLFTLLFFITINTFLISSWRLLIAFFLFSPWLDFLIFLAIFYLFSFRFLSSGLYGCWDLVFLAPE